MTAKDTIKKAIASGDSKHLDEIVHAWIAGTLSDEEAQERAEIAEMEKEKAVSVER